MKNASDMHGRSGEGHVFSLAQQLRKRRSNMKLSYVALGRFLGVHWTTIRVWELGRTCSMAQASEVKLRRFLNGDYDRFILPLLHIFPEQDNLADLPPELAEALANIWNLRDSMAESPELQRFFEKAMEGAYEEIYKYLTDGFK